MEPPTTPLESCAACGGQWFLLVDLEGEAPGQVCVDEDGCIAAYAGRFRCASCGQALDEDVKRPSLRVVET